MARQNIGVGDNYNRGSGDRLRDAFIKVNANENELYSAMGGSNLQQAGVSAGTYTANPVQMTVNQSGLITVINRDGPAATGVGPSSVALSADPIFTVSGSPIVSGSTITLNFATQNANLVLAAGTSGSASAPRFRNLTPADFGTGVTANLILAGATSGGVSSPAFRNIVPADFGNVVTANLVLAGPLSGAASAAAFRQLTSNDLASVAGLSGGIYTNATVTVTTSGLISVISAGAAGGVTSVGFSADPIFSVSGAPITASSSIALDWANQNANAFLAGPRTGSASAPSFRTLTAPDLPNWLYSSQTSGYGLVSADRFAVIDYTGTADGSWSAIDANTVGIGHLVTVHNSSASGQLIVDGHSTQLIDGFTNVTVLPRQSLRLMTSDASTWRIIGGGSYLIRQSIVLPAESFNSRAAQGATDGIAELGSSIVVRTKDFDPGTNWFIQKDMVLPDSIYDAGPLKAIYHASIASGSGVGVMGIQAVCYGSNSSLNVSFGTQITQGLTFTTGNALTNSGAASAPFVPAGTVAGGNTMKVQVFRDAGSASDTLGTNLRLHSVVIEYDAIRFGSDA